MKVTKRAIDTLSCDPANARKHTDESIAMIAASLRRFGQQRPILIGSDGVVRAGNGTIQAARAIGMTEIECIISDLEGAELTAYAIADNRTAELSSWDDEILRATLQGLNDLTGVGYDDADILAFEPEPVADGDPGETDEVICALGQTWTLGAHRLFVGDFKDSKFAHVHTTVIDPPYEIETLYAESIPSHTGGKLLVFWDYRRFATAAVAATAAGWPALYELVWDNVTSWFTPNRPLARHKACGVFGADPKWNFDAALIEDGKNRDARTVWNERGEYEYTPIDGHVHLRTVEAFPTTQEQAEHAHSKPLKWIVAMLRGIGAEHVYDPFGGSGAFLIACENIGIPCDCCELDPAYATAIIRRWESQTGIEAVNASR